jgi:metal-dependent amidase/aminoacylase/carboxypeptidase family protein
VTVGSFHAGTMFNVIPDTASFSATVRSFSREAHAQLLDELAGVCEGIASAYGLAVDAKVEELYPVTVNTAEQVEWARDCVRRHHGEESYVDLPNPLSGSEDFSRVIEAVPGAMVFLGATPTERDPATAPFNHSPEAAFDDSVLARGVALYCDFAIQALQAG